MSDARVKAQQIINENAVAVFSKTYCPYCTYSKDLLNELGAKFHVVELDQVENGAAIQAALKEINGQSTVPNIYIGQKHIGGNSDLQALKPKLPAMLAEAGAV
ncbi:Glutaredoxin [Erysiphe necator]|nr:Glutaredoxin [Erysiphe necator]